MIRLPDDPALPTQIESGPHQTYLGALVEHLTRLFLQLGTRANGTLPKDGTEAMDQPLPLATFTTGTLPTASSWAGAIIYVSDGSAGQKFRGSDGTSWVNLG